MIEQLRFYINHSINDMRVNRQRTLFALLCIAAGVAAIVSLQTLGVMIEDTLTGSVQEANRGDLRIQVPFFDEEEGTAADEQRGVDEGVVVSGGTFATSYFGPRGIGTIRTWFDTYYPGSNVTYRQAINSITDGISISLPRTETEKTFVMPFIVDVEQYPFYGERRLEDGATLDEAINAPTDIVLARNLADDLGAEVGDVVRLAGATEDFTVRGILPTAGESGFENIQGSLLGYYFLDMSAVALFTGLEPGAEVIYVQLAQPDVVDRVAERFEQRFPYLSTTTTTELEDQNSEISNAIQQLVIIMGLISLLIGGIGIVNTMLVIVSRRTTEVAVLKTIGLEGEQVTLLFLVEAVLMGIAGSVLGILLGWVAALVIKGVAEGFLGQQLTFRITLTPAITGFVVGVIVTTIFGFMPTLAAGQVRPNLVLRPSDAVVPRAGRARSFAALLFVMLAISLVAQPLIRDLLDTGPTLGDTYDDAAEQTESSSQVELPDTIRDIRLINVATAGLGAFLMFVMALTLLAGGIFAGWTRGHLPLRALRWLLLLIGLPLAGALFGLAVPALLILFNTFILVGLLYVGLWLLIWLVGRFFPAWRWVDLKLALRSMLASKGRNASTLLALVIGVFTLSLITMLASAIQQRFEELLQNQVGGNVIVLAAGTDNMLERVTSTLDSIEGVNSYAALESYNATLLEAHDVSADETVTMDMLKQRAEAGSPFPADSLEWMLNGVDARDLDANLPEVDFYAGRQLTPADSGPYDPEAGSYPPIVIAANEAVVASGLEVGDILSYEITSGRSGPFRIGQPSTQTLQFEIVGMVDRRGGNISVNFGAPNYTARSAFEGVDVVPMTLSAVVDVDEAHISAMRREMTQLPGIFVLETRLLNDLINQFIDQFTSFPILVAGLALVVGGIVIANSVALATLERRREIAIMKAVGLQRERVLGMLLMEYGLMGFIGGLIGVGLGGIGLLFLLIQAFGGELGRSIPFATAFELMLLCVGIALAAAVVTAWGASGEKPLNVLRYE